MVPRHEICARQLHGLCARTRLVLCRIDATSRVLPLRLPPSFACPSVATRLTPTVKAALSIMRIMKGLLRFSSRCNLKLLDGSPVTALDDQRQSQNTTRITCTRASSCAMRLAAW